ncbi:MAG TPA: hypothetical protein VH170_00180 [Chthoniobacterales bacterium]|nr:hypothetical protein [Chthoniobacterales bacterium]
MANRSKAGASASGKKNKVKPVARSTSTAPKVRKSSKPRKTAIEKLTIEAAPLTSGAFDLTDEQIAMRAYFISERRRRLDLAGDANSDWLEAKRQLLAEVRH